MDTRTESLIRIAKAKINTVKRKDIEEIKQNTKESLQNIEEMQKLYDKVELIKIQGYKGEDGYTPVKDVDYFDGKDGYTPIKGKDYFDGKDGYTPVKGKDYFDGKDGKSIRGKPGRDGKDGKSIKGKDGKDGSPDTPYEIRDKLSSLRGRERLDAKSIKNLDKAMSVSMTSIGGGVSSDLTTHIADTLIHVPIYIQETEPSSPTLNDLWIDTSV